MSGRAPVSAGVRCSTGRGAGESVGGVRRSDDWVLAAPAALRPRLYMRASLEARTAAAPDAPSVDGVRWTVSDGQCQMDGVRWTVSYEQCQMDSVRWTM